MSLVQHYEVPTNFILSCLSPYAKYSACLYPNGNESLDEAEILSKAQLKDGMDILDLGCGWGSVAIYLAQIYPASRIAGLSNSATQKSTSRASQGREIYPTSRYPPFPFPSECAPIAMQIITGDSVLSSGTTPSLYPHQIFEHMKIYELLLRKVASWLRSSSPSENPDDSGPLLFVHIFCHKTTPYHFEENDGWMA
ncbi:hypothetical protein OG21DRAFT_1486381 [Imleria badia]|nr:hypothetical protein OG21DRAFT_1486381 [Imleria badia]